jgi:hypothetical protein
MVLILKIREVDKLLKSVKQLLVVYEKLEKK